jgi:hypothetical protein
MTTGLLFFICVLTIDAATLVFDAGLYWFDYPTITSRVRGDKLMGVPIIVVQLFMVAGLAFHLFGSAGMQSRAPD